MEKKIVKAKTYEQIVIQPDLETQSFAHDDVEPIMLDDNLIQNRKRATSVEDYDPIDKAEQYEEFIDEYENDEHNLDNDDSEDGANDNDSDDDDVLENDAD
ncbi:hypothetical protein Adt_22286 [Abeliophyllum distichum]|uniref:Uncharacterized protein n=1 Tax=Abeliophyllum distichum TaxID=126358 RepID=A0ABD1T1S5_9LAMI